MPNVVTDNYRALTGPQKAAVMMLSLSEEQSGKLFSMMEDDEIKEISVIMASLGMVSSAVVEKLFVEFADAISNTGSLVGTYDTTERLLMKSLGRERVSAIMEEIRGPAGRTLWDKLSNVNEQVLATYFKNEYPQTVAVVLSKLKPEHSAKVLELLPEKMGMEVIMRMLNIEAIQKDVLETVEATLRTEFMSNLARSSRRDSHELVAEIFNNFDRNSEERFMGGLEERSKESADKVKSLMFTFDDLIRVDNVGIQVIIRNAPRDRLAIALKGASDNIKELFFKGMSERAGKMMREDMEALGPVRMRDVDDAQGEIVIMAKDLASKGEIVINDANSSDEMIY
ncbi:MAG: flagellar motor switch protein FliG [Alphaproteobacteria bacterium]|nr:flagellar motor switch protein FliG [Alphaproteobacteria bacterium]